MNAQEAQFSRHRLSWPDELRAFRRLLPNYADAALILHRSYGEVVQVRLPETATHLFHPELVDHVLRTHVENYPKSSDYEVLRPILGDGIFVSQGSVWSRQRKLLSPELRASVVSQYLPVIVRDLEQLFADRWEPGLDEPRDVGADFMFLTIRVVGDTIFARDFGEHADAIGHSLEVCLDQATDLIMLGGLIQPWMPTPGNLRARRAAQERTHRHRLGLGLRAARQHHHPAALAAHEAVGSCVEDLAPAVR